MAVKLNYLNTIWKYFEWEKVNFSRWYNENVSDKTPPEQIEQIKQTEFQINILYPHNCLSTNLTQLYTIFEVRLGIICEFLKQHKNIELTPAEQEKVRRTKDNFLWLKLLLKHLELQIGQLDPQFHELKQFQKLRNSIAHDGDRVVVSNPDDTVYRSFLDKLDGVLIQENSAVQEGIFGTYMLVSDYPNKRFFTLSLEFFARLLELCYPTDEMKLWEES